MKYVCGFIFQDHKILLVKKQKGPKAVINKLNGIGGNSLDRLM